MKHRNTGVRGQKKDTNKGVAFQIVFSLWSVLTGRHGEIYCADGKRRMVSPHQYLSISDKQPGAGGSSL
jgi:hypothetical protein